MTPHKRNPDRLTHNIYLSITDTELKTLDQTAHHLGHQTRADLLKTALTHYTGIQFRPRHPTRPKKTITPQKTTTPTEPQK